jgi:hypothetical protein
LGTHAQWSRRCGSGRMDGRNQGSEPPRTDRATLPAGQAALCQKWAMGPWSAAGLIYGQYWPIVPRRPPASVLRRPLKTSGPRWYLCLAYTPCIATRLSRLCLCFAERVFPIPLGPFLALAAARICTRPDQGARLCSSMMRLAALGARKPVCRFKAKAK